MEMEEINGQKDQFKWKRSLVGKASVHVSQRRVRALSATNSTIGSGSRHTVMSSNVSGPVKGDTRPKTAGMLRTQMYAIKNSNEDEADAKTQQKGQDYTNGISRGNVTIPGHRRDSSATSMGKSNPDHPLAMAMLRRRSTITVLKTNINRTRTMSLDGFVFKRQITLSQTTLAGLRLLHSEAKGLGAAVQILEHLTKLKTAAISGNTLATRVCPEQQRVRLRKLQVYSMCVGTMVTQYRVLKNNICASRQFSEQMRLIESSAPTGMESHYKFFDRSQYKANRQMRMSAEAKRILVKVPEERTQRELEYVTIALRGIQSIAALPLEMQQIVATCGKFEKYESSRIILKQGHSPQCFYFIIYGTALVCVQQDDSVHAQTKCYLHRGMSFGELAIVERTWRQSSVLSRTYIELLTLEQQDYESIFLVGGSRDIKDPEHRSFVRRLLFLQDWPMDKLTSDTKRYLFSYFGRGTVMLKDSVQSNWIYVIKTFQSCKAINTPLEGSVSVLTRLRGVAPTVDSVTGRSKVRDRVGPDPPFNSIQAKVDTWRPKEQKSPRNQRDRKSDDAQMEIEGSNYSKKRRDTLWIEDDTPGERRTLLGDLEGVDSPATDHGEPASDRAVFVHVQTLTKGHTFGLRSLLFNDQPRVYLVSNGAECLLINKQFYKKHCPSDLLERLKLKISPYPSDDDLQCGLQDLVNWQAYKQATVTSCLKTALN